ncbi:hypothetical protein Gohar_016875 [Gossypium harknessii]|uniref:Uncharacterized protein n=1 Tax=Gossypium harknessii TaxID=34285 RepID=A0A7J9G5F0_9ROSI|nr:hypothetical protein [Gossypium harknessii]
MKTMQCSMFTSRKKRHHYHPLPFPKPKLSWKCHQVAMRHLQPELMRHYRSMNPAFATWTLDKVIREKLQLDNINSLRGLLAPFCFERR